MNAAEAMKVVVLAVSAIFVPAMLVFCDRLLSRRVRTSIHSVPTKEER